MYDIRNANKLINMGWKFSGRGNGPLGENYWWPPARFYDQVPDFTIDFKGACQVSNLNLTHEMAAA